MWIANLKLHLRVFDFCDVSDITHCVSYAAQGDVKEGVQVKDDGMWWIQNEQNSVVFIFTIKVIKEHLECLDHLSWRLLSNRTNCTDVSHILLIIQEHCRINMLMG
jgi:hypothetical protein